MLTHLLYNANLFHEQSATFSGKSGAFPCNTQILARAAACDDVNDRDFIATDLGNVAEVFHTPHTPCTIQQNPATASVSTAAPRSVACQSQSR